jgi:hypothetical protein
MLDCWMREYRYDFAQPAAADVETARRLLGEAGAHLPARLARELGFTLGTFAR